MSIKKEQMGEIEIDLRLWNVLDGIELKNNPNKIKNWYNRYSSF